MLLDYKDWPHFNDAVIRANKYIDEILFHKANKINVSEVVLTNRKRNEIIEKVFKESAVNTNKNCSDFGYGDILKAMENMI